MKLLSTLLAGAMIFGLAACSSDEPANNGGNTPESKDGIYATVKFRMPQGRSTGKDGEETGKDYENAVKSILVVMTLKPATEADGYKFLTFAYTDAPALVSAQKYTINFENKLPLFEHATETVCIFAYCNPTADLVKVICGELDPATGKYPGALADGADFTDLIKAGDLDDTWTKNSFLMTSVKIREVTLPDQETLKGFNNPNNAFSLGDVEVIRTASRFDFKDASENGDLTYSIKDVNDETKVQGTVTLTRAALFNLRNQFYYLPRTQADATAAINLCPTYPGMEEGFVISPADRTFSEALPDFIDPLNPGETYTGGPVAGLKWYELTTVLGYDEDNHTPEPGWPTDPDFKGDVDGYHIWRYGTENTFAPAATGFPEAETTGIVFEAKINVAEANGAMYLFDGTMYPSAETLYNVVKSAPGSKIEAAFNVIFDVTDGTPALKPEYATVTDAAGFTIYRPNEAGDYLCYYFYYNRHNDDGEVTEIGDMEFATVRNNVYKLSVSNIKKFGTFTPTDIDEWDVYFNLNVLVRNWVVRINQIEF